MGDVVETGLDRPLKMRGRAKLDLARSFDGAAARRGRFELDRHRRAGRGIRLERGVSDRVAAENNRWGVDLNRYGDGRAALESGVGKKRGKRLGGALRRRRIGALVA